MTEADNAGERGHYACTLYEEIAANEQLYTEECLEDSFTREQEARIQLRDKAFDQRHHPASGVEGLLHLKTAGAEV